MSWLDDDPRPTGVALRLAADVMIADSGTRAYLDHLETHLATTATDDLFRLEDSLLLAGRTLIETHAARVHALIVQRLSA